MDDQVLDNPIFGSLTTLHRALTREAGGLLRYPAEMAPFLAAREGAAISREALAALVAEGEEVFMLGARPVAREGVAVHALGPLHQMVCDQAVEVPAGAAVVALGDEHRPLVLELTSLVYPHYFRPMTMALGRYFGVIERGHLAAMIGERMGMPGFREISAVCTHPEFVGRGLARRLLAVLGNDICARGDTPFLHVSPSNARAKTLYEQNGWRTRKEIDFWSVRLAS